MLINIHINHMLIVNIILFKLIESKQMESQLASQHFSRIHREAKCQTPMPRVVNIQKLYPSATKRYTPHCTILHYCGHESGCCPLESDRCAPKRTENVELYFWIVELTPNGHKKGVEMLKLVNHTECECQSVYDSPR